MTGTSENICLFHERNKWKCFFLFHDLTPNNKYLLELIKKRLKVQEKNMPCERGLSLTNEKHFPKTNVTWDFSQSSFRLRRGILLLLTK